MQAVSSLQPFDLSVDGEFALRLGHESNNNLADQPEGSSEGKMPWSPLVGNHVTEVIIEDINDLIIGDCIVVTPCRLLIHQ